MEVLRYYLEFPECQEIKCMRKQWIPGSFRNGPGYEAKCVSGLGIAEVSLSYSKCSGQQNDDEKCF